MMNEPISSAKLSKAAVVCCIGVLALAIMALFSFLAAAGDRLLCKVPAFAWPPGCSILLPHSPGVCRKIGNIEILSLIMRTNFENERAMREYGIMDALEWSRIVRDDPFLNFDLEGGAFCDHMPLETRARYGGLYVFADRRKDVFSVGNAVISGGAAFFTLEDWEATQV